MKQFETEQRRLDVVDSLSNNPDLVISSSASDDVNAMMMCDAVLSSVRPGQPINRSQVSSISTSLSASTPGESASKHTRQKKQSTPLHVFVFLDAQRGRTVVLVKPTFLFFFRRNLRLFHQISAEIPIPLVCFSSCFSPCYDRGVVFSFSFLDVYPS